MKPKMHFLVGTTLALPLLTAIAEGAMDHQAPGNASDNAQASAGIPLNENQLDGITAGAETSFAWICLDCRQPPIGWVPPQIIHPPVWWKPPLEPYPPIVTTLALGEEGGIVPVF